MNGNWIDVNDRLPENGKNNLLEIECKIPKIVFVSNGFMIDDKWMFSNGVVMTDNFKVVKWLDE